MKIPETGPSLKQITEASSDLLLDDETRKYSKKYNDVYLHWDDLKYREFGGATRWNVWALMKITRSLTETRIRIDHLSFTYNVPEASQLILHQIDTGISKGPLSSVSEDAARRTMLSVSSTMEESIASSQLEGASTTTDLAKKLLRNISTPENRSQRMILNNYRAMQFIKGNLDQPLTPELIRSIHRVVTRDTLDDASFEGEFRADDGISARDTYEDVTYHVPVGHEDVENAVEGLCRYANEDKVFVHPIVKGIILHFILAYIHPFVDGNGRVSRSLFYWFALRSGYTLTEFLSISKIIKEHRQKYDLAFLKTETDENDLTYFIRYNLDVISEAISVFCRYAERKNEERRQVAAGLRASGLNLRQSVILKDLARDGEPVTVQELAVKYQTTQTTIRRDLIRLSDLGYVRPSGKDSHKQLYVYSGKKIR